MLLPFWAAQAPVPPPSLHKLAWELCADTAPVPQPRGSRLTEALAEVGWFQAFFPSADKSV